MAEGKKINYTTERINELLRKVEDINETIEMESIRLGNYIIQYNTTDDSLDFIYSNPNLVEEIITGITYERGEFLDDGGLEKSDITVRSSKITIEKGYNYYVYFEKPGRYFRYYLYSAGDLYLGRSDMMDVYENQTIAINLNGVGYSSDDVAYIRVKFGAMDDSQDNALVLSQSIQFIKTNL